MKIAVTYDNGEIFQHFGRTENFKIYEVEDELEDLDKEKALAIAKRKGNELKEKAEDLVEYAREKGTPVLEKAAKEVRQKAIMVTREVLKRLEDEE